MKKLTKRQVVLIPVFIICVAVFCYLFFQSKIYSIVNFLKQGLNLSEPLLLMALLVQIYFSFLFAFVVWLAVLSFKDNAPYSSKRRIALIVLAIVCAVLLILSLWYMLDNLVNTLEMLKELQQEYPNHPAIQEIQKAIPENICYNISLIVFYGVFIWLSLPFLKKQDKSVDDYSSFV